MACVLKGFNLFNLGGLVSFSHYKVQLQDNTLEVNYQIEELAFEGVYYGSWVGLPKKNHQWRENVILKYSTIGLKNHQWRENVILKYSTIGLKLEGNFATWTTLTTNLLQGHISLKSPLKRHLLSEPVYDGLQKWIERDDVRIWDYKFMQLDKRKWPWRKLSESLKLRSTSFNICNCLIIVYVFMFIFVLVLFILIQGILSGLEHLYEQQKCYGNLLSGITISNDHKVKLVLFGGKWVCLFPALCVVFYYLFRMFDLSNLVFYCDRSRLWHPKLSQWFHIICQQCG